MSKQPVVDLTLAYYRAAKSATSCVVDKCGDRNIQFHHVEPVAKKTEVSKLGRYGTIQELIKELEKCVPVCEKHHREIHYGLRKGWLCGRFDNGQITNDTSKAERYLPFKPFFTGLVREV